MTSDPELERRFDRAMVEIYERARSELGYTATRYLQMLSEYGGLGTARRFLASPAVTDGFATLWEAKRLDLTVEAHVLRPEFRPLFTSDELGVARSRLAAFGYQAPDDRDDDHPTTPASAAGGPR